MPATVAPRASGAPSISSIGTPSAGRRTVSSRSTSSRAVPLGASSLLALAKSITSHASRCRAASTAQRSSSAAVSEKLPAAITPTCACARARRSPRSPPPTGRSSRPPLDAPLDGRENVALTTPRACSRRAHPRRRHERLLHRREAGGIGARDARDELQVVRRLDRLGDRTARPARDAGHADADHAGELNYAFDRASLRSRASARSQSSSRIRSGRRRSTRRCFDAPARVRDDNSVAFKFENTIVNLLSDVARRLAAASDADAAGCDALGARASIDSSSRSWVDRRATHVLPTSHARSELPNGPPQPRSRVARAADAGAHRAELLDRRQGSETARCDAPASPGSQPVASHAAASRRDDVRDGRPRSRISPTHRVDASCAREVGGRGADRDRRQRVARRRRHGQSRRRAARS